MESLERKPLSVVWGGLTHLLSTVCINIDLHLVA